METSCGPEDPGSLRAVLSMIALHGLADSTAEVDQFVSPLVEDFPTSGVHWVFPRAPRRPVTLFGGRQAHAWYDVLARDRSRMDEVGLERATSSLVSLVESERARGVPAHRIVLAGFSQGGALALHAGLRLAGSVGGIVALSSAVPLLDAIPPRVATSPPLFLAHGFFDRVIPFSLGHESKRLLVSKGYDVEWRTYPTGHTLRRRQLADVADWLERRVLSAVRERVMGAA